MIIDDADALVALANKGLIAQPTEAQAAAGAVGSDGAPQAGSLLNAEPQASDNLAEHSAQQVPTSRDSRRLRKRRQHDDAAIKVFFSPLFLDQFPSWLHSHSLHPFSFLISTKLIATLKISTCQHLVVTSTPWREWRSPCFLFKLSNLLFRVSPFII